MRGIRPRLALAIGLSALVWSCSEPVPAPRYDGPLPDVVIVLIDTLRADFVDLGDGGGSPFLAGLARESVVFEDASSAAPWTLPSVASLVTGRHVAEHGVVDEGRALPTDFATLAERLGERGYATRAIYRNAFAGPMCHVDRGYEVSLRSDVEVGGEEVAPLLARADGDPDERPLLLYVHNAEPHDPQNTPANKSLWLDGEEREFLAWYRKTIKRYRAMTRRGFQEERRGDGVDFDAEQARLLGELLEHREEARRVYARAVKESDERIASLVERLRERGRWDRTLFVVVADHGEEMGEHGGWLHDQSLYQELVHVPLLVRFPGGSHGGERVREPVSLIDLLPTILGTVGLGEEARELPGRDWHAALADPERPEAGPRVVSIRVNTRKRFGPWERSRGDREVAVRDGKWKAIWSADLDRLELYDVGRDPGETEDLAERRPEVAENLRRFARERWQRLQQTARAEEGGGVDALDDGDLENLRGLGYLGDDE